MERWDEISNTHTHIHINMLKYLCIWVCSIVHERWPVRSQLLDYKSCSIFCLEFIINAWIYIGHNMKTNCPFSNKRNPNLAVTLLSGCELTISNKWWFIDRAPVCDWCSITIQRPSEQIGPLGLEYLLFGKTGERGSLNIQFNQMHHR